MNKRIGVYKKVFCKNGTWVSLLLSFSPCVLMKERSWTAEKCRPTSLLICGLYLSLFVIGVICSVRYDNMVEEVDAHDLTSLLHALRQCIVNSAGTYAAAGVVMADCHDGRIVKNCLTYHNPYICTHLGYTSLADALRLDKAEVLIYQQDVKLFRSEVLHLGQHVVVDTCGSAHFGMQFGCRYLPAFSQFNGCEYLAGGLRADSLDVEYFIEISCIYNCLFYDSSLSWRGT